MRDADCCGERPCLLLKVDDQHYLLASQRSAETATQTRLIDIANPESEAAVVGAGDAGTGIDLGKAKVEVRTVTRRQLYLDGKPVGDLFE